MGWFIPAAIGAAAGFLGKKLAGDDGGKGGGTSVAADPYGQLRNALNDWLIPQIGQPGKQYTGEMVAPLSEQEGQSFDFLRKYGEQGDNETLKNARGEINKTLTNQYDPTTSPYYQAVKAQAAVNLQDTQRNIASNAAGAGRYWTGARLEQEGKAARDSELGLNTLLGALSENERQRRLDVLPQAGQFGEAEQQLPLQQATAYQALGALPRNIQQAGDTATQNEWLRSQVEYPMQIANIAAGVQTPPTLQQNPPSGIQQLLTGVGQGVGQGAGNILPLLLMQMLQKK